MTGQPNIVLVNCDDLGYGDLGCYGSLRNHTPTIDRLAAEGLRFTDFYMASPVCSPSRGAMLTGSYPPRIGFGSFDGMPVLFPGQGIGLNPDEVTIAEILRDAGYRTKCVGKWHCGDQPEFLPTRFGFDSYYGLPYSNDMGIQVTKPGWEFLDGKYPPLPLMFDDEVIEQQPDQAALTERYVEESLRFIRSSGTTPFFLYFAHLYVHVPIYVQHRFEHESDNGRYGAAVACIDWALAVLLHELDRLGLADDTIVIFTSDNGSRAQGEGGSNDPLRSHKATTWEGGQRVPCIVRWPGHVPAGTITNEIATSMDFLPTLRRAATAGRSAGGDDGPVIDGRDLTEVLLDPANARSPHEAFLYYWMNDLEAIRVGRWKLHLSKHGAEINELYDLHLDVAEANDVHTAHPDVVADLLAHAERARRDLGDARLGVTGSGVRAPGRVVHPHPLTTFDPAHPYSIAMYDLGDRG